MYSELGFAYSNLLGVTTPRAIKDVLETQKKNVQKWFDEVENLEFERPQKTHILFRKLNSSRNQKVCNN